MASSKKGVYTFWAQGQIYHDLPPLLPIDGNPRFLQLYFYDSKNELQNKMNAIGDGKLNVNEVAAIWIEGNNSDIPYEKNIIVQSHSGDWHRIKHYYGCYDPLQYPILHPNGESGWHQNIKKGVSRNKAVNVECQDRHDNNQPILTSATNIIEIEQQVVKQRAHVSCREYYAFKLQIREGTQSILLFSGRLLQQFVVDMYIKLESTRLDYYRTQQSRIRSELYQGIVDCVNARETRANRVGIKNVLPASFIGGPRDMRRRYLDSMALVQRYGKPDIFLTVTCNQELEEITIELAPGQTPQNRPDLTSRIFHAKLQDLKDQLYKKAIFGKVAAHVHVIEFQKRGLPHAHFLIILKQRHKMTNLDQYDHIVTIEIPNKEKFPELYKLVVKHMMHGPCGKDNEKCPCMINGKCRYHYPRPYSSQTTQGKNGYAIYRRRNDGRQVKARGKMLDNRWVVPHNAYLLTRYNCHINVEIFSGLKAVKYLYKYVYKGHDRIVVYIVTENGDVLVDEIQQFQDARWVLTQKAIWRIFEFQLNEIYPPVINLQLHLPHKQSVTFWENQNLQHVLQLDHISRTMLTEYFNTCSIDEDARKLLYKEFPEYYVWNSQQRAWCKQKKGEVIGPINAANPREGERYFLRLLLNHVKGPTSFDDLLTVDDVPFSTFKQSAMRRGLLESDQSILECIDEAVTFQMP